MPQFTVTVSEEELRALEWDIVDVQEWIQNAISNKARQCVDAVITKYTDKQPNKLSVEDRLSLIGQLSFESAAKRQKELEAE